MSKKRGKEQYLDAKYVTDNPNKFDYRDVAKAKEFCEGYEAGQVDAIVIDKIESHIKSMIIEAEEHAKMGDYTKALSLKEQTTGFKRAIDVIKKHIT